MTKDEKAAPEQQKTEQAGKQEKPDGTSHVVDGLHASIGASRDILQLVEESIFVSRRWPRVTRALLPVVGWIELMISINKKAVQAVAEHFTGTNEDAATEQRMADCGLYVKENWRARGDVSKELILSYANWLIRDLNGRGKHFVLDAEDVVTADPQTLIRPLAASWSDLAADQSQNDQEWRFLTDVNHGDFCSDQRWHTRMNPEQEVHISAEGSFIGRESWNPKIQIRPIGATWKQLEQREIARSKSGVKPQGVN